MVNIVFTVVFKSVLENKNFVIKQTYENMKIKRDRIDIEHNVKTKTNQVNF